ncbi:MAG: site-specific integrase [Halofilum sp. (in: g-proteobacteria)]|nr:site-specific integrase [Halofilum sp. (in: g-proteobacteria)]
MNTDWRMASRDCLLEWRDAQLQSVSPKTGEPYSPNTVRVRMLYVLRFVDYATAQGWYDGTIPVDPATRLHYSSIDDDPLAHTRKGASVTASQRNKLLPKNKDTDVVDILRRSELAALFAQVGPRPTERDPTNPATARDWLVLGIPAFTGLRKSELLSLTVHPFQAIVVDQDKPFLSYDITVLGKGNKTRAVSFPGWLVSDIQTYIHSERARAVNKRRKRESQLLLVQDTHPRSGQPLKVGGVNDIVERTMVAAGLVAEKLVLDPDTGERTIRSAPRYSIHSLRHTYAVHAYHAHRAAGETAPWKLIQMQLGHKSPRTTMEIYLKYVHLFNEKKADVDLLHLLDRG